MQTAHEEAWDRRVVLGNANAEESTENNWFPVDTGEGEPSATRRSQGEADPSATGILQERKEPSATGILQERKEPSATRRSQNQTGDVEIVSRWHATWSFRGYIPHVDGESLVQHITFHLADSL
ncbi:MAG: hypothetical protein PHP44_05570, partial [Kiritimatiellae bacterium]|nr:hypothetical protein [Kiritimatiellia bacterium]